MKNVVKVYNDEPRCGTLLVARAFDRRHEQIMRLVKKHEHFFLKLGNLPERKSTSKTKPYMERLLNNNQVLLFLSILRGEGGLVNLKAKAIKATNIIQILERTIFIF